MAFTVLWKFGDISTEEFTKIADEIITQNDRVCALVGSSFLEKAISNYLSLHFVNDNERIKRFMIDGASTLGDVKSKMHLCYLLGAISKEASDEFSLMFKIRNKFAHNLDIRSFEHENVRPDCFNLKYGKRYIKDVVDKPKNNEPNAHFRDWNFWGAHSNLNEQLKTARGLYVASLQALLFALNAAESRPPMIPEF